MERSYLLTKNDLPKIVYMVLRKCLINDVVFCPAEDKSSTSEKRSMLCLSADIEVFRLLELGPDGFNF